MARTWPEHGLGMAWAWPPHGLNMARARPAHGQEMATRGLAGLKWPTVAWNVTCLCLADARPLFL
eukprot:287389-Lingulodinium_polyedra.AAC.1